VTVVVSEGPQPVVIPDLVSRSVAAATSALQALGLQVGGPYGPAGAGRVLSTDPAAGTAVKPGSTVYIYSF
jgi:serine/threonine-protein kinase